MISLALLATGGTITPPAPSLLSWDGTVPLNVVVDGNSYYATWIYPGMSSVGGLASLITAAGATHSSVAVPGYTWDQLTANHLAVSAKLDPARTNVLVVGEDRNSAAWSVLDHPARTSAQHRDAVVLDARRYIAARRAEGWDYIVRCNTIPSAMMADDTRLETDQPINDVMVALDAYWADSANRADAGVAAVVDFRAAAPEWFGFEWDGSRAQGFMASTATCANLGPGGTPDDVHPVGAARAAMADAIAATLQTLTVTP